MIKDFIKNIDDNLKTKIYWGFIIIMSIIAVVSFYKSHSYDRDKENMLIPLEKKSGYYKILSYSGPEPFIVDMVDLSTNDTIKNVFISKNCPKYKKNTIGMIVKMNKLMNLKVSTGQKVYTYSEGYDALCTNKKVEEINQEDIQKENSK